MCSFTSVKIRIGDTVGTIMVIVVATVVIVGELVVIISGIVILISSISW